MTCRIVHLGGNLKVVGLFRFFVAFLLLRIEVGGPIHSFPGSFLLQSTFCLVCDPLCVWVFLGFTFSKTPLPHLLASL